MKVIGLKKLEGDLLADGGDFGREVLDAASAAALTQDVSVQRVTASAFAFRRQQETAFLRSTDTCQWETRIFTPILN